MEKQKLFTTLREMIKRGLLHCTFAFAWHGRAFTVTRIYQDTDDELLIDYRTPEYSRDSFDMSGLTFSFLDTLVYEAKLQCQRDRNLF